MVTGLPPLPTTTLPSLPLIVTVLSPVVPLLKVDTPFTSNATLPLPASFVMEVILVRSPLTFTLYGLAVVPAPVTVVLTPASNFVLSTDTL